MAPKRREGPEPQPSREKLWSERQLRKAVRAYCEAWHRWYWGDDRLEWLDYAGQREQWPQTARLENAARPIRHRLERAIQAALAFAEEHGKGAGGLTSEGLIAAKPHLKRSLHAMRNAIASRMVVKPSRTTWLRDCAYPRGIDGRRPADVPIAELTVYSLLAGWWPDDVKVDPDARVSIARGVSVARVLTEEKRNIRKAVAQLRKRGYPV